MKIFALICSNGLGHYKRTIEILEALKCTQTDVSVTVACESWQIDRMKDLNISVRFWNSKAVQHLDAIVAPGVHWSNKPEEYCTGFLTAWHKRLQNIRELQEADLVVSDNLPQVLHYRPDAILIGSFLWSDILTTAYPQDLYVQQFAEEEKRLLLDYHPPMICLSDMVMKGVLEQTKPVRMPWFCIKKIPINKIQSPIPKIGVLGGATESMSCSLIEIAQALSETGKFDLFLPQALASQIDPSKNSFIFDFEETSFKQLNAIICRPGIGTLTDGVRFGIPVITVHEAGNIEMMHNAANVQALKIGLNLGSNINIKQICERIVTFVNSEEFSKAKTNICARPDHGIEKTVNWILENYN